MTRLGLTAHPLDVPMRVIARVMARSESEEDVFVDAFAGMVLSRDEGVPRLLATAGVMPDEAERCLSPARPSAMLIRATRNIFNR
jgi:hypothetical protein